MICYRNISSGELDLLLSEQDIIGKCKVWQQGPYTITDKEIKTPVVCFFLRPAARPDFEHPHFIKCDIPEERILSYGVGQYGDIKKPLKYYFYKELYVEKYNYLDVIEYIN